MNQDAVENPSQSGGAPDFQRGIREKHGMARDIVVLIDSDVDPQPIKDAAKPTTWRRQVSANWVDPLPVHPIITPSHKRLKKNDWFSKINALKNRITTPTLSSLDVFSTLPKKAAGDVDLVFQKEKEIERPEDGVDPSPHFAENIPTFSKERSKSLPQAYRKSRDVDGDQNDGVPVPAKKRHADFDCSLGVDSPFYDYEGSHCVDDVNRFSLDERSGFECFKICQCVDFSSVHSDCVDPLEEYRCFDSRVKGQNSISKVFTGSANILSSSIDALDTPGEVSRDWEPHEAEAILSDIYQDLGEVCICVVEDGCICALEECQCPDPDTQETGVQGLEEANEDVLDRENTSVHQPEDRFMPKTLMTTQMEGTSTDSFHHANILSRSNQEFSQKSKRRRNNNKLSERVICKRGLTPQQHETEVDPKDYYVEEPAIEAVYGTHCSDAAESVDPSPVRISSKLAQPGNVCDKSSHVNDSVHQTKVSPDMIFTEDYNTDASLTHTETSIGDSQVLLDCIAVADDSISKVLRVEVDEMQKAQETKVQIPVKSQTEISEDGFSCHTEMESRSPHGIFTKRDYLAFKNDPANTNEDENANKHTSDISQTSCALYISSESNTSDIYNLSVKNKNTGKINVMGDKKNNIIDLKPNQSNAKSMSKIARVSVSPLRQKFAQKGSIQDKETTTEAASRGTGKPSASDISFKVPVNRVHVSRIPKRRFSNVHEKNLRKEREALKGASGGCRIKNTRSRSSDFPSTATQSKVSENKFSCESQTKTPHRSNSQYKPTSEDYEPSPADEEQKPAGTLSSDKPQPYVPQVITFYKHKDAKVISTIPPAPPKSPQKAPKTSPQKLRDWNCSTAVEKRRMGARPKPLLSKRHSSSLSIVSATSESSRQSLSSARNEESTDRMSSSLSVDMNMGRSQSECSTSPQRSNSQKMNKRCSSPTKQPFLPAGSNTGIHHGRKKPMPVSNTARSHPDLRVPGQVEVPVVYPSSAPQKSVSNLGKQTGMKRAHEKSFDEDCKKAFVTPVSTDIYPMFTDTGLNANSSNSAAVDQPNHIASSITKVIPIYHHQPWPVRKINLCRKCTHTGSKSQNNSDKKFMSGSLPTKNNFEKTTTYSQLGQYTNLTSKLPVPCRKYGKMRKLGCVRCAGYEKMKPSVIHTKDAKSPQKPQRVECLAHAPLIGFAVAAEDLQNCLYCKCLSSRKTYVKTGDQNSCDDMCGSRHQSFSSSKAQSTRAPQTAILIGLPRVFSYEVLEYFIHSPPKNEK